MIGDIDKNSPSEMISLNSRNLIYNTALFINFSDKSLLWSKKLKKTRQIDRGNQNKAGGVQFGAESAVARRLYFKKPVFIWRIWRSGLHCRKVRIQFVLNEFLVRLWSSTRYDIKEFHGSFNLVYLSSLGRPEVRS